MKRPSGSPILNPCNLVGVVLTLNNERMLIGGSLLDEAMESTLQLVRAPNTKALAEIAKRLGPPPIRAAYKWADDQLRFRMTSNVEWRREERVRAALLIQRPELERFRVIASETSEEQTEEVVSNVELVGADSATHSFHLILEEGTAVRGKCSPEVIGETHSVELPKFYRATLVHTIKIRFSTEEPEESWLLTHLEKV